MEKSLFQYMFSRMITGRAFAQESPALVLLGFVLIRYCCCLNRYNSLEEERDAVGGGGRLVS